MFLEKKVEGVLCGVPSVLDVDDIPALGIPKRNGILMPPKTGNSRDPSWVPKRE